jgi:hypothetical protein
MKKLCEQCVAVAAQESKCLYYGFSFNGNDVHCREAYEGAEGLLTHLSDVGPLLSQILKIASMTRLEVHGTAEQLAKLVEPMAGLAPTYFNLEYGIRRSA